MYKKSSWTFNDEVSWKFDHHVRQSVPFYELIQLSIAQLSDYFVSNGGLIYDLGCSTGETIHLLDHRHPDMNLRYIGIDSSRSMLAQAMLKNENNSRIVFKETQLEKFVFAEKSRLVFSVLTLQFIPVEQRKQIIQNVYEALYEGGAFIFVEKTLAASSQFQDMFTHIQYDMKVQSGLTHQEVILKEDSLRGTMIPLPFDTNLQLLRNAGFEVDVFLKHWQFTGFVATKPYLC